MKSAQEQLAVSMIVKNEEGGLGATLDSIGDICSEIVISDTGSTDGTVGFVAKWLAGWVGGDPSDVLRIGDRIVYLVWSTPEKRAVLTTLGAWWPQPGTFEFDTARNYALAHVTRPWVLSVDADELVTDEGKAMLGALNMVPPHIRLITLDMEMQDDDDEGQHIFAAERLIRRGVEFRGHMHNWVNVQPEERAHWQVNFFGHTRKRRTHESRREREMQRHDMAETHFRRALETNPEDRRALFYLATDLMGRGKGESRDEAIELFYRYLRCSPFDAERYQASLYLARALRMQGRDPEAMKVMAASRADAWYRPEGPLLMGDIAMGAGDYKQAKHWYVEALRVPKDKLDPMFLENEAYTWRPYERLGRMNQSMGNDEKAERFGRLALAKGAGYPDVAELGELEYKPPHEGKRRMAVFCDRGQTNFILPLLDYWGNEERGEDEWEIRVTDQLPLITELLDWCDVAWFEWAGPLLIRATQEKHRCRMIVRIHGYEVHSGYIEQVYWPHVDDVVFTAHYLGNLCRQQAPDINECRQYMISGGVQLDKYAVQGEGKQGNKVAMACYLNYKKNLPLALQVFRKALDTKSDLELHIAGEWQDSRVKMYFGQACQQMGIVDNVFLHEWQEDLNAFYADKDFYLSSSIEESFHYSCMEAMACGLKSIVHCWLSADDYYPAEVIFRTVDEGAQMILDGAGNPQEWRAWVENNTSFDLQRTRLERVLNRPKLAVPARDEHPWHIERRISEAGVRLGCRVVEPKRADVVIACDSSILPVDGANGAKRIFWGAEQVVGKDVHAADRREKLTKAFEWSDSMYLSHPDAYKSLDAAVNGKYVGALYLGGVHQGLVPDKQLTRDLNFGFCGVVNPRREAVLEKVSQAIEGDLTVLQSYDPSDLAAFYHGCKVVVNPHCTDERNVETRIAEALACGAVVFTEPLPKGTPFEPMIGIAIFATARRWNATSRETIGEVAKQALAAAEAGAGERGKLWAYQKLQLHQQVEKILSNSGV